MENLKNLEKTAKALSDINRLKILELLASQGGTGPCSSIQDCLNLAQPSVSHHLKILQEAGLIRAEKAGRQYTYTLQPTVFKNFISGISFGMVPVSG
ncbi:ArsR/SmtB family transcription factor [Adhaeribacter radiodurans]|nr:metalloregulator ArsR/SmtB family transcription factor [Adhaeribacter radiodurans]